MSSRKRKQKPPEKFSEEKRTKMTWNMFDQHVQAMSACEESTTTSFSYSPTASTSEINSTSRGLNSRKRNKKQTDDRSQNLELNLDNTYSPSCVCQLGLFNVSLCTSKTQEAEVRTVNGANVSSLTDELWITDCLTCVIVRLSFEPQSPLSENMDLNGLNNGCLRQVSFRAAVPSVSKDRLEALVYLQNKGVVSLVLRPEQRVLKDCWEVVVCLNESGLTKVPFASMDVTYRKTDKMTKVLMEWFYKFPVKNDLVSQECNNTVLDKSFDGLYDAIKSVRGRNCSSDSEIQAVTTLPQNSSPSDLQPCHSCSARNDCRCKCNGQLSRSNGVSAFDVQHPFLKPVLRGYQRRAVKWMLRKEQGCQRTFYTKQLDADTIHPLWREVHSLDGKLIYFNPYTGRLTKERFCLPSLPLGGILADEMGLGKTVEVIACILCHRKPSSDHKSLNKTATAGQYSSISQTSTATSLNKEPSKLESTERDISSQGTDGTVSNTNKPDPDCSKIYNDTADSTSDAQVSTCSEAALTLCNGDSDKDNKTVTEGSDDPTCTSAHSTTPHNQSNKLDVVQSDQEATSSEFVTSVEERTASIKCQCICGINVASCDDKLLQCCGCQAVFHAECLNYNCPGEFLCPHCAVNRPAIPSRATLIISPAPIAQQWVDEISRHTEPSTLKLLVRK
ncbi:hypothetical protein ACROYT_G032169 [Oculina patagonica]